MDRINKNGAAVDSVFLATVKIVTTVSAIIQTKILSVGLSLTDYGTYSQINVVVSIVTSLLLLGFGDAINYFFNRNSSDDEGVDKVAVVNSVFGLEFILGTICAIIIIVGQKGIVSYFDNNQLYGLLVIISFKPMLDNMLAYFQVLFVSVKKAKVIAIRNLVISLLKLAVSYVTVLVFQSLELILICLIALDLIQLLAFYFMFQKNGFSVNPFKIRRKYIIPILKYSLPMGVYAFTSTLSRDIDRLVIGNLCSTEELAIYNNCSKILPFDIVSVSFATVLIPYIMQYVSEKRYDTSERLIKNYMKIGYFSAWILGGAVLTSSSQAIEFLYSSEYLPGLSVFVIYIFDSMIKFASMHLVITASGNSGVLMKYSVISLLGNAILNVGFYYCFGFVGPAIATLVVSLIYTLAILNKTKKIINTKFNKLFDFGEMAMLLIVLVGLWFGVSQLNWWLSSLEIQSFLIMLISAGTYCIIAAMIFIKPIIKTLKDINNIR